MKYLIVVDMQNDFITGSLANKEAEAIVDKVADKIRNFDGQIICTMDTHDEYYLESAEGQKLPIKHCIKDTEGWQINSKIMEAIADNDSHSKNTVWFVKKHHFGMPSLFVRCKHAESIEMCGICTDICVVSNAIMLHSCLPKVPITVDSKCCAGTSIEAHHAALITMQSCQIDVK